MTTYPRLFRPLPISRRSLLVGVAAIGLLVALPAWQNSAQAQTQTPTPRVTAKAKAASAPSSYTSGLALEKRGDNRGAYDAFHKAAATGYPPAQRRLGEIYDVGNSAVERNYEESIRWYQKAREGGEQIPPPKPRTPVTVGP